MRFFESGRVGGSQISQMMIWILDYHRAEADSFAGTGSFRGREREDCLGR